MPRDKRSEITRERLSPEFKTFVEKNCCRKGRLFERDVDKRMRKRGREASQMWMNARGDLRAIARTYLLGDRSYDTSLTVMSVYTDQFHFPGLNTMNNRILPKWILTVGDPDFVPYWSHSAEERGRTRR